MGWGRSRPACARRLAAGPQPLSVSSRQAYNSRHNESLQRGPPVHSHARRIRLLAATTLSLLVAASCDHAARLPTSTPAAPDDRLATARLGPADETGAHDAHRNAVIPEARQALGAILTGEQAYYQRFVTFIDAADISALSALLGVELGELSGRWAFGVSNASETGFVAIARGLDGTKAEGFIVTLDYARGHRSKVRVRRLGRGHLAHS